MAGKDPAVLWYFDNWSGGTSTLTRHQKGCYMDLLNAQFNQGHLSETDIKTVLGSDFSHWNALRKKFALDENGFFYNGRLEEEIIKRKNYTESRRKNASGKKSEHKQQHMGDGDGITNFHSVFALRLLSNEGALDKEAVEISTKTTVNMNLLTEFHANLKNSNVTHHHFSEYKKHLVNWIPKKPKLETPNYGKQTRKGHDIENVVSAADRILLEHQNKLNRGSSEQSDTDISTIEKRA